VLVFVSRDFELGRNVSSEQSTVVGANLFSNVHKARGAYTQCDSPGAACDAASVHFRRSIRRTVRLVSLAVGVAQHHRHYRGPVISSDT